MPRSPHGHPTIALAWLLLWPCGGLGTAGHYKEQKLSELSSIRRRIRLNIHFECDSATVLRLPGSIPTHDAFILAQYGSILARAPAICDWTSTGESQALHTIITTNTQQQQRRRVDDDADVMHDVRVML